MPRHLSMAQTCSVDKTENQKKKGTQIDLSLPSALKTGPEQRKKKETSEKPQRTKKLVRKAKQGCKLAPALHLHSLTQRSQTKNNKNQKKQANLYPSKDVFRLKLPEQIHHFLFCKRPATQAAGRTSKRKKKKKKKKKTSFPHCGAEQHTRATEARSTGTG